MPRQERKKAQHAVDIREYKKCRDGEKTDQMFVPETLSQLAVCFQRVSPMTRCSMSKDIMKCECETRIVA